jgi:hydrogenase expression/formation protein HypC
MCLAIPGLVIEVIPANDPALLRGRVDFGGVRKEVSLAFTPDVSPGKYVLVHAGFALNVVDEVEAKRIFDELNRMDELGELEPS